MSLCRLSEDSDVSMYEAGGVYCCHFCTFNGSREVWLESRPVARVHLLNHRRAGERVPQDALDDLTWWGWLRDLWFDLRARVA